MADARIKRELGRDMPTGENDLSQYRFTVTRQDPMDWTVRQLMSWPHVSASQTTLHRYPDVDDQETDRALVTLRSKPSKEAMEFYASIRIE